MSSQYGDHLFEIVVKSNFDARSCYDLDLQGSDANYARKTSSQYGDHFCEIVLKSDLK